jgi:hypothetical protein
MHTIQKQVHIIILAYVVKVLLPVIKLYKLSLNGIVSNKHLTLNIIMTAATAII